MPPKKGLGRGLDALLDPYTQENEEKSGGVAQLNIRLIDTNRSQPRKSFDEDTLHELASSISSHGIVQPLIVKQNGERYTIIAGERRFRAARIAGLETVPAIVAEYDEEAIHEVALIENIQREDLNPIEEAAAMRFLMKQHDLTQEEISKRLGKSRPAVANALRLLDLPQKVVELLKNGELTAGHGRALAGLENSQEQEKLALEAVRLGYSVRALEHRVKNLEKEPSPKKEKAAPALSTDMERVNDAFREKLETKVVVSGTQRRGRIVIEYYSKENLDHIYQCILGKQG